MPDNGTAANKHVWRFFRSGGFDQVAIETAADLRHLAELDAKLWTALNCPAAGLEFDARTLALLDSDQDGQIRVPEILAAVEWTCRMLKDPQVLFDGPELALGAIDDSHTEGATVKAAASRVLGYFGKTAADRLAVSDFTDLTRLFSPDHPNGDGVVPRAMVEDDRLAQAIDSIVKTQGGTPDRSGEPGMTAESLEAFFEQVTAELGWQARATESPEAILPLGAATAVAAEALAAVAIKIDDYFARCRLAAFDARAVEALNPPATVYATIGERPIAAEDAEVAALPLAAIAVGKPLPLTTGVNPAWAGRIARFREAVVTPLLGPREALSPDDWATLSGRLAPHRAWQSERPATSVQELEKGYLEQLAGDDTRARLAALINQDLAADASAANIDAVERLVRYHRDLVTLLRNFVTLSDFYDRTQTAIFQAGTLYLDQRSCELVLRVADMARHATLAPFSGCYLVYCTCERADRPPITIVAALTCGAVDELMVPGRNGVFYDREGHDWKATVVKIIEQPVSIRQAFWSPYRRIGHFIESLIRGFAASRDKDVEAKTQAGVTGAAAKAGGATPAPVPAFDIAKFAGIFAAIGLAVGAVGTALTAALSGLLALSWWQLPLALIGIMLAISAPSMLLAFLTLRRRNLGPLLDANGWAVNARARINIPFGSALTEVATLPPGSTRSLIDPYAEKRRPWKTWVFLVAAAAVLVELWRRGVLAG